MSYATLQEQEHYEHEAGACSELQNCLFEARLSVADKAAPDRANINRALALGLFVVVKEFPQYCKATDAFAGTFTAFVCAYPSREAAEKKVAKLCEPYDADYDVSFGIIAP
jgi:hypothetical protein